MAKLTKLDVCLVFPNCDSGTNWLSPALFLNRQYYICWCIFGAGKSYGIWWLILAIFLFAKMNETWFGVFYYDWHSCKHHWPNVVVVDEINMSPKLSWADTCIWFIIPPNNVICIYGLGIQAHGLHTRIALPNLVYSLFALFHLN